MSNPIDVHGRINSIAKAMMASIEIQRKNVETSEIVERVAAIERTLKQRK